LPVTVTSPSERLLRTGRNCWRVELANRAAVIVDAADYFRLAKRTMLKARQQIMMIGWDFDTRIFLDREDKADEDTSEAPNRLGDFLLWLAKSRPDLEINILKWDIGALKLLGRGTTFFTLARWAAHSRITFKLDSAHPPGASHHQKILVIDDAVAFCGGIDMTGSRWDTREHRAKHPLRRRPTTGRSYMPWHDVTMALDGNAARALGELARARWSAAGGDELAAPSAAEDVWPRDLNPQFRKVEVGIARTRGAHRDLDELRENEALFVDLIASARRFVYSENQYFASRVVAEAIAKRLTEQDGPEFVLVQPKSSDGWLQEEVMGSARSELIAALASHDRFKRFRLFTPVNQAGEDIYVHAKVMIVDDRVLRVGSANLNNRSMGLDSECDLVIDAGEAGNEGTAAQIAAIRSDLIAEHLGVGVDAVERALARTGSLLAVVEELRGPGRSLRPFEPPPTNAVERQLADSELLDPESAEGLFEPAARPGLLARLGLV
jgi:phosphatidylserine/phosphatidylglycerophosphate/cardiolipin synthase-like enzyme